MANEWMRYTQWFQQARKMRHTLYDEEQRKRFDALIARLMEMDAQTAEDDTHHEGLKCYEMLCRRCMAYLAEDSAYGSIYKKDDMWRYIQTYIDTHPLNGEVGARGAVYGWYLLPIYCAHLYDGKGILELSLLKSEDCKQLLEFFGKEELRQFIMECWRIPSEHILDNRDSMREILLCTFDGLTKPLYRLLIDFPIQLDTSWIPQCQDSLQSCLQIAPLTWRYNGNGNKEHKCQLNTKGEEKMRTCAFTGYRPEKLPFGQDEESPGCMRLKQQLFCETLQMTDRGVTTFLSGMARGVDTWAAETVLQLRRLLPPGKMQFWAVVPYAGQADAWSEADRERYRGLLARADKVVCLSETYTRGCMQTRNRYLVDHANFLIAVYDGKPGGTKYTVEYARKKGLEVVQIEP